MYELPSTLSGDIKHLADLAKSYTNKEISAAEFKAYRVPMGVYEQRKNEVYMARTRTTGGIIHPSQFLGLIDAALKHKSNLLHVTTRQEIQVHNLNLDEVEPLLKDLQAIKLSTKGGGGNTIRNIMLSEFSGIKDPEAFDCTPAVNALTTKLIAESDSFRLPRKIKTAFSSNPEFEDYAAINDLGLIATVKDGKRGFIVNVGGGAGGRPSVGWRLFDFMPVEHLFVLANALKNFFSEHGNRKNRNQARLRFVFYKLGEKETLRLLREYFDEALKTQPLYQYAEPKDEIERPPYSYAPALLPEEAADEFKRWQDQYVIQQRQNHYFSAIVPLTLGNIPLHDENKVAALRRLLHFLQIFGENTLRFTPTQNIRVRNIPKEALPELFLLTRNFADNFSAPLFISNLVSCTGADTCRLGICFSKGLARAISAELLKADLNADKLKQASIHISGCPNSCGQQLWADLGFTGRVLRNSRSFPGYQVYVGARRDHQAEFGSLIGNINAHDAPIFTRRLLEAYVDSDFTTLSAYLRGPGRDKAVELLNEYKQVPTFEEDKNYYYDWGADQVFTSAPRGKAECSAGIFDMIGIDQDSIKRNLASLKDLADRKARSSALYNALFSASRMLLVTRGLDPRSREDVFNFFIESFIAKGLVDVRFKDLVLLARDEPQADFNLHEQEIIDLAARVNELYKSMDDSLQFKLKDEKAGPLTQEKVKAEAEVKTDAVAASAVQLKDLRGVACPMNFVMTKIELEDIPAGGKLEVILDDGAPIENVPRSVKEEGHKILSQERKADGWHVLIEKHSDEVKAQEAEPVLKKDLRGVACPMNFVMTKLELEELNAGDILEIRLDDGAPIENVPRSVREEGHQVLSEVKAEDGSYLVRIKKVGA